MRGVLLIVALTVSMMASIVDSVYEETYAIEDPDESIKAVHWQYVGRLNPMRFVHIHAVIENRHLTTQGRYDFGAQLDQPMWKNARAPGDVPGHLVPPQFSGSPKWYNLTPQYPRVNRNMNYQAISTEWYGAECEARRFLEEGSYRRVHWTVNMTYEGNADRPNQYILLVRFEGPCGLIGSGTDIVVQNLHKQDTNIFWTCKECDSNQPADMDHHLCTRELDTCSAVGNRFFDPSEKL